MSRTMEYGCFVKTETAAESSVQEELRRSTQLSVDPRAVRTREAIVGAVHDLIAEGVSAPTVSEIVGRAGVSRPVVSRAGVSRAGRGRAGVSRVRISRSAR